MSYSVSLEITVRNKMDIELKTIDLFNGIDDVKEELIALISDEQIKRELDLVKPNREDYEDEDADDYIDAVQEYEDELEGAIEDYKYDIEFSDFDKFLKITGDDGNFEVGFTDFEEVENILNKIEEVRYDSDWRAILAIYNSTYQDLEKAIDICNDGDFSWYPDMSMEDVIEEQIDNGFWGEISDKIRGYLDTEAMARDLSHDGYSYDEEANGVIVTY